MEIKLIEQDGQNPRVLFALSLEECFKLMECLLNGTQHPKTRRMAAVKTVALLSLPNLEKLNQIANTDAGTISSLVHGLCVAVRSSERCQSAVQEMVGKGINVEIIQANEQTVIEAIKGLMKAKTGEDVSDKDAKAVVAAMDHAEAADVVLQYERFKRSQQGDDDAT